MAEPLFPVGSEGQEASPRCPFCDGDDTVVLSGFGGQLSVSQCWCRGCRTGFDRMKWDDAPSTDGTARKRRSS